MELSIAGRLFSGMGKGRYYVGHPEYRLRFKQSLGYVPYPGTLNLKLEEGETKKVQLLRGRGGKKIEGFKIGDENFSALQCFDGRLKEDRATLLLIDVTYYNESVIELISPTFLRGKYALVDGDVLEFRARLPD